LRIPLLEEIFKQFPTMPMNIEIKTPSHEAIEEFRNLLKKYKREHLTIWGIRGPLHEKLK
jgi:glycerophosphoryl diester phosphodiesterase